MNHGFDSRKLGLGTVQFGQAYGVSNSHGQVPVAEVQTILAHAANAGVGVLDTAAGYGEAENVLGTLAAETKPFRIVTKTISIKNGIDAVVARARQSVQTLKRRPVDLLMVHAAGELAGSDGDRLWNALLALRDEGLFGGIGISAYVADDPAALAARFRPAAMQVPFSVLDQRLLASDALARLQELGVEVHARSLFLQGLLFVASESLPQKLKHIGPRLDALRARLGASTLEAALAFVLQRPEIDVAIVGVTRAAELDEIITAAAKPAPSVDWNACALDDEVVLTPSLW
ncbi:MAG TPA: aldo/keto reductase [Rhizomicrobium sp.]|nr:aldo/keto reductase [Rhizomicrobium sp.]